MAEIIPVAVLTIDNDRLEVTWICRGCGVTNLCFTFSEHLSALRHEIKSVDKVTCTECCRSYEVD